MSKHLHLLFCALTFVPFSGCYYLYQGSTLLKHQCCALPNRTMLADSSTPGDVRKFLCSVEEIRRFAVDSVGLKKTKSYSRFVKIKRDYLVDNVYAARADTFAQHFWRYPFLGAMPYKGFFDRIGAEKEARTLQEKGYDVHIGRIAGFSTLGILRDPVYSFMKEYGPYSLANLLLHELTHATVFIKSQSRFNEEIATFIGREAGLRYVAAKYGPASDALNKARLFIEDEKTYQGLLSVLYRRLDSIYRNERSPEARIALKNTAISDFKRDIAGRYDSLFKTKSYAGIAKAEINNATLMIAMTYSLDLGIYYELYRQCGNDLKKTVAALGELQEMEGDPRKNLMDKLLK
ncbi:MAG: aminopeptidase [Chitinispirillaceae bacterium]|nr:aminopeptidase [Chitinispirillaceae bacterium]